MKIFFMKFHVAPTTANKHCKNIECAYAECWVNANDLQSAFNKASFDVKKYDWEIKDIEVAPIETKQEDFYGKAIEIEQYKKAQEQGIAVFYTVWSRDRKTFYGPLTLEPSHKFNLFSYLSEQKKLKNSGHCLHYDSGVRCNNIIDAHSIQKNGSLSAISENGKVYAISKNIGDIKKHSGKLVFIKVGIGKVSTFRGLCKEHDNELFEPIDKSPLLPTDQQICLYAYRSICRELFVKENAFALMDGQMNQLANHKALYELCSGVKRGTSFGLNNLIRHKKEYDLSLKDKSYADIKSVLFTSPQKLSVAFSGLFYPDKDFRGRKLQDLGDEASSLDLITFCSAPMNTGWGFLFSWHKNSSSVCVELMRSLAIVVHDNGVLSDYLFRLVISNCENIAISPSWWESLPDKHRECVIARISNTADVLAVTQKGYLMEGLEGIAQWNFETVISNMV